LTPSSIKNAIFLRQGDGVFCPPESSNVVIYSKTKLGGSMNQTLNNASFIATLICISLFFLATSSSMIVTFTEYKLHIHPLSIVLVLTLLSFLAGFAGLFGVDNGRTYAKGMATILVSAILMLITGCILVMGSLLG
jgi:hypothetical protein